MEIVQKTLSETQTKRRLLLAAYLSVAVPVSSLLWRLLTPAPQLEPRPFLPMRDALTPMAPMGSSLLLPPEDGEATVAEESGPAPARLAAHRPTAHRRASDGVERLVTGLPGGHGPAGMGHAILAHGRLTALGGLLSNGGGSGAQSAASHGGGHSSAPLAASAGPLGSVGLVRGGSSKRFSPARLQSGGVNGFMGSRRPGLARLVHGANIEPELRAAASAGLPGYATAGQPQPGGLASVGGEVGIGESNKQEDSDNSSSSNPALPLSELPEAGPAVDAWGMSGPPVRGAACQAYTQAVTDSAKLLESLRAEAKKGATALMTATVRARTEAITWKGREATLLDRVDAQLGQAVCEDSWGNDYCRNLRQCLRTARASLTRVETQLEREVAALYSAGTRLYRAPGAGEEGYNSALDAIALRDRLKPMVPAHLETIQTCEDLANDIPTSVCGPAASSRGCVVVDFAAGRKVKQQMGTLAAFDRELQAPVRKWLALPWCKRFGCPPADLAQPLTDLAKHAEALQVWAEEAPREPVAKTADAAEHLERAAALLKAPHGDGSRNFVNGALELERAAAAMAEANGRWSSLKDEACGPTK